MALMPILRTDPWRSMESLRDEINRLFESPFRGTTGETFSLPSMDILEDNGNYYVEMDLPGLEKKDIKVELGENNLTISAKKEQKREEKNKNMLRNERFSGSFYREIELPGYTDPSKVKANYSNGVLTVTLPKVEEKKKKENRVEVQ